MTCRAPGALIDCSASPIARAELPNARPISITTRGCSASIRSRRTVQSSAGSVMRSRSPSPGTCSADPVAADQGAARVGGAVGEQAAAALDDRRGRRVVVVAHEQRVVHALRAGDDQALAEDLGRVAAPTVRREDAVADVAAPLPGEE